jgi:hypothetical protein
MKSASAMTLSTGAPLAAFTRGLMAADAANIE